jgi:predicted ATP-grasp superfamily ATP-dependent carboligase
LSFYIYISNIANWDNEHQSKIVILFSAIEQEKEKQNLFAGIENFDTKKLKHTETQEKNPLPTKEG